MEEDLPVDRECSRSRGELSAGRLSPLRSAPVSYPVSKGQEGSQNTSYRSFSVETLLKHTHFAAP